MAEINGLIHNIERGRDLDASLSGYCKRMHGTANRLAAVQFVMNYTTFYDSLFDFKQAGEDLKKEMAAPVAAGISELNGILEDYLSGWSDQLQKRAVSLRDKVESLMTGISALSDRFTIFEYIVNRKEAAYVHASLPAGYRDEEMTQQLMKWLASDQDLVNMRLTQLVEQLPMRMSKNRFFQILETGLGVYADAERKSLEDELEMIRSSVLIQEPEEMALFRELDEALSELEKVSFESMTAEEFRVLQENMGHCSSVLNDITTVIVMLAELVNQLCVMILSEPQAIAGLEEKEGIREILGAVLSLMKGGIKEPVSEALYEQFAFLEGKQELLMDGFAQGASAVDEICQEQKKRIENLGLSEEFESLRLISRLMSGSLFVELREDESLKQICGKDYTRKAAAKLQEELLEKFEGLKKYQVRAVMAKVLSFLPPFLLSGEEVRSYIAESLGSCKDEAEKIGCVEILTSLLSDY